MVVDMVFLLFSVGVPPAHLLRQEIYWVLRSRCRGRESSSARSQSSQTWLVFRLNRLQQ